MRLTPKYAGVRDHSKGAPMSWAKPLLNPFVTGLDLDLLAMRLEADMNEENRDG